MIAQGGFFSSQKHDEKIFISITKARGSGEARMKKMTKNGPLKIHEC